MKISAVCVQDTALGLGLGLGIIRQKFIRVRNVLFCVICIFVIECYVWRVGEDEVFDVV